MLWQRKSNDPSIVRKKLDDLMEPSTAQIDKIYGTKLNDAVGMCTFGGRGIHFLSERLRRTRKQTFLATKEIPHCAAIVVTISRGALPQPVAGWCTYCQHGIQEEQ